MLRQKLMFITDVGMLLYWVATILMALKLLNIPPDWLFNDYEDPRVVAWNWSFFPIDLAFSLTGLKALQLEKRNDNSWRMWAVISLTLTVCAGLMAISYWVLVKDFALSWWIPNLFLMIWPIPFIIKLTKE